MCDISIKSKNSIRILFFAVLSLSFNLLLSDISYSREYDDYTDEAERQSDSAFVIKTIKVSRVKETTESGTLSAVTPSQYDLFWYRVNVVYASYPPWSDGVVFKYYVLVREKSTNRKMTLLVDEIEYNSVPRAVSLNSFVFLHPRTIQRYGKPEKVMCEIWHKGVRITRGFWPKPASDEWWVKYSPLQGALKAKYFTPFVLDKDLKEEDINIKTILD